MILKDEIKQYMNGQNKLLGFFLLEYSTQNGEMLILIAK